MVKNRHNNFILESMTIQFGDSIFSLYMDAETSTIWCVQKDGVKVDENLWENKTYTFADIETLKGMYEKYCTILSKIGNNVVHSIDDLNSNNGVQKFVTFAYLSKLVKERGVWVKNKSTLQLDDKSAYKGVQMKVGTLLPTFISVMGFWKYIGMYPASKR